MGRTHAPGTTATYEERLTELVGTVEMTRHCLPVVVTGIALPVDLGASAKYTALEVNSPSAVGSHPASSPRHGCVHIGE